MRVLILICVFAGAGCYSPGVEDCQFKCGANDACPDGTTCMGTFCRSTTTGSCTGGNLDAPACPVVPAGCSTPFQLDGGCGVACNRDVSFSEARSACVPGWQLAVLDSAAKLDAVPSAGTQYWVGASRSTPVTAWLWINTAPIDNAAWSAGTPAAGNGEDCANLDANRLKNDVQCSDTKFYVCTSL